MEELTARQLAVLDPSGARQKMFSRHNRDAIRVGDVLRVRRKNGEQPFAGVLINIRRRGVDSAFLLRGQVTRLGVEVWFKLYSPTIEGIDLVQRREKRARRAKLYYMRYVPAPLAVVRAERAADGDATAGSPSTTWAAWRILLGSIRGSAPCCGVNRGKALLCARLINREWYINNTHQQHQQKPLRQGASLQLIAAAKSILPGKFTTR